MAKWFNKQARLFQIIMLIIPVLNWIIEIGVRWSKFFNSKGLGHLLIAFFVTITGLFFGVLDAVWCLLFHHLIFAAD